MRSCWIVPNLPLRFGPSIETQPLHNSQKRALVQPARNLPTLCGVIYCVPRMMYSVAMADEYLTVRGEQAPLADEDILLLSLEQPALFAQLVVKYQEPFSRKARSIVQDEKESEDIVQEAFLKIYLNASKFKKQEGAQFSSWGYRILINTALTHYSKRKREGMMRAELDPEILELIPDKHMIEQFHTKELSDEIASVLIKMPPLFAHVLTAFFIDGKPQEEIAQQEGVSVGAIKTRVHRAKREFLRLYKAITPNI